MDRTQAWQLLNEYIKNPALIRHSLAVEAAMRFYAGRFGEHVETWAVTGLLHDFDYERWPEPPAHTREGAKILRAASVDEEIVGAILSHAEWNRDEYPRDRPIRKTLFAVDELCGFITAVAVIRPERIIGLGSASVKKKLKSKGFAAAVSREDIDAGAKLLEIPLDEHIQNCIDAMTQIAADLELGAPRAA
ncbi:MAG TPA: HDIG domain-containing protein [Phycisphaerae bacterium]